MIDLLRITLYCNKHKRLSHDSDPAFDKLGGCDSDNSFWYSDGYRSLPFFLIKPKLKIEDCHTGTDESNPDLQDCSFYLHNAGKRTAIGVRIKFKINQKLPKRPKPPKLVHEFGTLNPNFPQMLTPFDLDPDETILVRVCEVTKDQRAIFQLFRDDQVFRMPMLSLESGRKYELLFRFVGRNFSDRKVWHLFLDLKHEKPMFALISRNVFSQYLSDHLRDRG
ncbi:MAG: hypothetical protein WCD81_03035 [Candidatus Bathyarchaeia archaeon]